jgi:hypothetical protein
MSSKPKKNQLANLDEQSSSEEGFAAQDEHSKQEVERKAGVTTRSRKAKRAAEENISDSEDCLRATKQTDVKDIKYPNKPEASLSMETPRKSLQPNPPINQQDKSAERKAEKNKKGVVDMVKNAFGFSA